MREFATKAEPTPDGSIEGMDAIFSSIDVTSTVDGGQNDDQGWSLSKAAETYGVTDRTIRRWIKQRVINAWKVNGPRGPEWRIQGGPKPDIETINPGPAWTTVDNATVDTTYLFELVQDLQSKLAESNNQLQAASYRNGYLESQLQERDKEIKLLSDSQKKDGRWHRIWNWFTGQSEV